MNHLIKFNEDSTYGKNAANEVDSELNESEAAVENTFTIQVNSLTNALIFGSFSKFFRLNYLLNCDRIEN